MRAETSLRRAPLGDEAASYVRDQIIAGELAPGSPVRPETIAADLGISSTPAREALKALQVEGFLELEPRRGFTVARVTGDDIRDIFLVQSSVAGELAARAALRMNPPLVERLQEIHDAVIETVARRDADALEDLNYQFHRLINLAANSPKLVWVIQILTRYTPRRFYATKDCACSRDWPDTTVEDHGILLAAMRSRDAERARSLTTDHVQRAGEQLAHHIDARLAEADCTLVV